MKFLGIVVGCYAMFVGCTELQVAVQDHDNSNNAIDLNENSLINQADDQRQYQKNLDNMNQTVVINGEEMNNFEQKEVKQIKQELKDIREIKDQSIQSKSSLNENAKSKQKDNLGLPKLISQHKQQLSSQLSSISIPTPPPCLPLTLPQIPLYNQISLSKANLLPLFQNPNLSSTQLIILQLKLRLSQQITNYLQQFVKNQSLKGCGERQVALGERDLEKISEIVQETNGLIMKIQEAQVIRKELEKGSSNLRK